MPIGSRYRCPRGHSTLDQQDNGRYYCLTCDRRHQVTTPTYDRAELTDTRERVRRRFGRTEG